MKASISSNEVTVRQDQHHFYRWSPDAFTTDPRFQPAWPASDVQLRVTCNNEELHRVVRCLTGPDGYADCLTKDKRSYITFRGDVRLVVGEQK